MLYLSLYSIAPKLVFMIEKLVSNLEILLYYCVLFGILIIWVISSILLAILPLEAVGV